MLERMKQLSSEALDELLIAAKVKARLRRELKFAPETIADWSEYEFVAISDRTRDKGVLVIELDDRLYAAPYTLTRRIVDKQTGRSKPITCDFCYTWQGGSSGARISFTRTTDQHNITLLCCADLSCSAHVRGKTSAAKISRANLREDLTNEQRIERLRSKLRALIDTLQLR